MTNELGQRGLQTFCIMLEKSATKTLEIIENKTSILLCEYSGSGPIIFRNVDDILLFLELGLDQHGDHH